MRKIAIFLTSFFVVFFGASSSIFTSNQAFAQSSFFHSNPQVSAENLLCNGWSCGSVEEWLKASKNTLDDIQTTKNFSDWIQDAVIFALSFVTLIGVVYILWAGFRIMTGNGDSGKLESSKKTIIYVVVGMIVIWLAYSIVSFVQKGLLKVDKSLYILPQVNAQAFTESNIGNISEYKAKALVAIEELEAEMNINKYKNSSQSNPDGKIELVSYDKLNRVQTFVNEVAKRLPDRDPAVKTANESGKRAVDMYLQIALNNRTSEQSIGKAISQVANYLNNIKIQTVQGSINATPSEWNAPLTVSFLAQNVTDPSGTTPPSNNYIWWIRENGNVRRELGRGPSLVQTFTNEGTYSVFLDVISASKNSNGYTDVLPLSQQVNINVKPKLGEVILLINGVNVSNLETFKISPTVASQGLIFDATASRSVWNGSITKTSWTFDNGNSVEYKGSPIIERQIYATEGMYNVKLSFTTNDGREFTKTLQLVIKDPAAVIKTDKTTVHTGDSVSFTAESYLGDNRNVEYLWQIQDANGNKSIKSSSGMGLSHTFSEIGTYIVTLRTKSPNGNTDSDSKTIVVEAREPVAGLDSPQPVDNEHPNTFVFDASKSYDPDSNSRKDLQYTWTLNGTTIALDNLNEEKNRGTYTFNTTWENKISVTVSNKYGKVATAEQSFRVNSVLAGDISISPQVTQINKDITFSATSKNAEFFEWNFGDGTPTQSGNNKTVTHTYSKTGNYQVTLTLRNSQSNNPTTITRTVYVTNTDSPFALINVSNTSNSVITEAGVCNGQDAFILKRAESVNFNAGDSINIDGSTTNLDYTWKYMGKVSTLPYISETFTDIGCYPIELTVRSKTNGAKHTTTKFIKLTNQAPQFTNISTNVDSTKKDSQKVLVKVTANGAKDPDGIITSYTWYYTTESDKEPQSIQITQTPEVTFVLPNIEERYYFGLSIEDNDGAYTKSTDVIQNPVPLIISNNNGNAYLPLITLSVPSVAKVGEKISLSATARTLTKADITNTAQFSWDFDGDGKIDEKTSTPQTNHTYTKAGTYNIKVRVTNNGVSNTKYQTITVRNELKAKAIAYRIGDKLYLMNASEGSFDTVTWSIGDTTYNEPNSLLLNIDSLPNNDENGNIGKLTISSSRAGNILQSSTNTNNIDSATTNINVRKIQNIIADDSEINVQTSILPDTEGKITIADPSQSLKISLYGNNATAYAIDSDIDIDTDLDGTTDNDIDNKEENSYKDGSLFIISNFSNATNRERKIKITLYNGTSVLATKTIPLVLDFVQEKTSTDTENINLHETTLSDYEKQKLESFATLIRSLDDADRIVVMKYYNTLVENWDSDFEKAKTLIDIQSYINNSPTVKSSDRAIISDTIDEILIGDAQNINNTDIALKLIRSLIPTTSDNYSTIMSKIDEIASHPSATEENRAIGKEILTIIQNDSSIEDKYKLIIKGNLQNIINQNSETTDTTDSTNTSTGGFFGIFKGIIYTFLIIIGIICVVGIGIYIFYRINRKDDKSGFQDFIIDRVAHGKSTSSGDKKSENIIKTPEPKKEAEVVVDPLKTFTPPQATQAADPLAVETPKTEENVKMPDWLTPQNNVNISEDPLTTQQSTNNAPQQDTNGGLPDWLKPHAETTTNTATATPTNVSVNISSNPETITTDNASEATSPGDLPDWLKPSNSWENFSETPSEATVENIENNFSDTATPATENNNWLPDWLQSEATTSSNEVISTENNIKNTEQTETTSELPDWLKVEATKTSPISENEDFTQSSEEIDPFATNTQEIDPLVTTDEENFSETNEEIKSEENTFSYTQSKTSEEAVKTENIDNSEKNIDNFMKQFGETSASEEDTKAETETVGKNQAEETKKSTKPVTETKKKSTKKPIKTETENENSSHDNIPDWLK